ncbi:unnamed protein product [Urochloa decumbens]|uniref:DUF6598 domain-containing protein n=1 Tax=Urochloa decumbens TaxID=240449 RepID=A0ABC8ZCQ1_9POAL
MIAGHGEARQEVTALKIDRSAAPVSRRTSSEPRREADERSPLVPDSPWMEHARSRSRSRIAHGGKAGEHSDVTEQQTAGSGESSKKTEELNNGIKHSDLAIGEKKFNNYMFMECEYKYLLRPFRTWEEKVVMILHVVRNREFTQFDPSLGRCAPYRFNEFNIAFFDFDKESEVVHGPQFRDIHPSRYDELESSFNVISIKITESDVRYPMNIYGTILARDYNDYRCVYLFKRGRDDPQVITRKNRVLALTGPYRALAAHSNMYFEFDLKMKGEEGAVDEDFSKGFIVLSVFRHTSGIPCTFSLNSYLSSVDMVCVPLRRVLEASIGVNFFNGKSTFTGKIFASTSGSCTSKMVMYDSKVAGTKTQFGSDGSVSLSRHIVAVPRGEDLLLYFVVCDSYNKCRRLKFVISHDVDERTCNLGTYRLQVKIIWKGVFRQHRIMLKHIGDTRVLW